MRVKTLTCGIMSRLKFSEFGMEATGHYWLPLYAHLRQAGQTVHVINPLQSDALRNIFLRQTKNYTQDALIVAEVIRFGRYCESCSRKYSSPK
ncbi:MAG: transposase [Selenomonadaceae bacterium]|nr:transposase [Selenomonadaceae bacterium]